jgi:5-methylthioadenosine/S-adenosylhomocysteine deaminase
MPIHGKGTVISDLVYSAHSANVDTTIVNGRVLMERRRFTTLDPHEVFENVSRATDDLVARSAHSS